jgi:hypothetical protein
MNDESDEDEGEDKMETDSESEGDGRFDANLGFKVVKSFREPDMRTGIWTCTEKIIEDGVERKCGHEVYPTENGNRLPAMRASHMKNHHTTIDEAKAKILRKKPEKTTKPTDVPLSEDDLPEEDHTLQGQLRRANVKINALTLEVRKLEREKADLLADNDDIIKRCKGVSCVYCVHACCMRLTYAHRYACKVWASGCQSPRFCSVEWHSWQC